MPSKSRRLDPIVCKPCTFTGMQKIVHNLRDKFQLPKRFTLDDCGRGGMTE